MRNNVKKIKLVTDISTGQLSRDLADHGFVEIYVVVKTMIILYIVTDQGSSRLRCFDARSVKGLSLMFMD